MGFHDPVITTGRLLRRGVAGASLTRFVGPLGGRLKIKIAAPPEGGKANTAIRELVAAPLGLRPRQVSIVAGRSASEKVLEVRGIDAADARRPLGL